MNAVMLGKILPRTVHNKISQAGDFYFNLTYRLYRHKRKHERLDFFFISFPKSGRTWVRAILGKYFQEKYHTPFTTELKTINHPEIPTIEFSHKLDDIKYHKGKKVVCMIRDPRDVVVSYYHQLTKRRKLFDCSLSEFVHSKKYGINKIIDYLNTMIAYRHYPSDVLWIKYENLHENTLQEMTKILEFIGMKPDKKKLTEAINFSKFEKMQKMEKKGEFDTERLKPGDISNIDSYKVRKGKIGSYREELSEEDIAYINTQISKRLRLNDYR